MTPDYSINISAICALVPAFNEDRFISTVIDRLRAIIPSVVVIDDGSTDETAAISKLHGASVVTLKKNSGKGNAIRAGLEEALNRGFSYCLLLDADLQHAPEESVRFLDAAAHTGCSLVIGNRFTNVAGMPLLRKLTNRFMSWLVSRMCHQQIPDTQCGFRLIRADLARIILSDCNTGGFDLESEMLFAAAKRGYTIESVPTSTRYGAEQSKIHKVRDTVRFSKLVWNYRDLFCRENATASREQPSRKNHETLAETHT